MNKTLQEKIKKHWWTKARSKIISTVIDHFAKSGYNLVAEIGCGSGVMIPVLSKYGRVIGIDNSQLAIVAAKSEGFQEVFLNTDYQWKRYKFDIMCFLDVLEHNESEAEFLDSYLKYLKLNGLVIIAVPALPFLWGRHDIYEGHKRRYTKKTLLSILPIVDLVPLWIGYFNFFLFPIVFIGKMLGKLSKKPRHDLSFNCWWFAPILEFIFSLERIFVTHIQFPLGGSLLCVARKLPQ